MGTHHPDNERIKRQYLAFLKEAKRQSEATVDAVAQSLACVFQPIVDGHFRRS